MPAIVHRSATESNMPVVEWLQRHNSHTVQLVVAGTIGAVTAAGIILTGLAVRRRAVTDELKASIPALTKEYRAQELTEFGGASRASIVSRADIRAAKIAARARKGDYDEELVLEQLARNRVFLTDRGLKQLRNAFVIVVGLGGVGSHATAALVRSGVSKIRVVDFDQVTLSSLNRHAVATLADVGTPKVYTMRKRLEQIAPWCRMDCRNQLFSSSSAEKLLGEWDFESRNDEDQGQKPDFVLDCIDNIDSKVALLHYCHLHNITVISAMGAGCKSDPTKICVGDISTSIEDPLSKATRRRLRLLGVKEGIPVVYSTEKPGPGKATLLPVNEEEVVKGNVGDLGVLPDFRVRILPVLGTMPAVFGYAMANHVICSIAEYPLDYRVGDRGREKMYESMLSALQGMEERLVKNAGNSQDAVGLRIPLNKDDVGYLVEEIFRGRSVVSGLTNRLALVRWRRPKRGFRTNLDYEAEGQKSIRLTLGDLVIMTKEEAQKHEKEVLGAGIDPEGFYEPDVVSMVERRNRDLRAFDRYR